jgi:pimeloyl-ACP methyl ester carboxylesterase
LLSVETEGSPERRGRIVWGDKDGIIPVEHADAAHEAIPHSQLEIIEGPEEETHSDRRPSWLRTGRSL